jgi:hypothetical protein
VMSDPSVIDPHLNIFLAPSSVDAKKSLSRNSKSAEGLSPPPTTSFRKPLSGCVLVFSRLHCSTRL